MTNFESPRRTFGLLVVVTLLLGMTPAALLAGMPMPLPDDVTTVAVLREGPAQHVQVISFFLVGLLATSLVVKLLWNGLRLEFQKLPRISVGMSLLVTVAWGLLFCIVLVMISGARELMTPGAWEKNGATYQLNEEVSMIDEAKTQ